MACMTLGPMGLLGAANRLWRRYCWRMLEVRLRWLPRNGTTRCPNLALSEHG